MEVNKQQLIEILGISKDNLKKIESKKQLSERLKQKGYTLIKRYKEGKKVYYTIEQDNNYKEVFNNMAQYIYKTKKEKEFSKYFTVRTKSENVVFTKKDISNIAEVSSKTVARWDNILIDKDIIKKDGYFYFYVDTEVNNIVQCSEHEYKSFWKNKAYINAFRDLQHKYINGIITLNQLTLASAEIGASIAQTTNKYYYRVKKYITNKDNKLYIDTSELIKILYGYGVKEEEYNKLLLIK